MRIYLSGPIKNEKNYRLNFLRAENTVRSHVKGSVIVSPMRLEDILPNGTHKEFMELCYSLVGMSNVMVMLPGWEKSRGARKERTLAIEMKMPIVELDDIESINSTNMMMRADGLIKI